MRPYASRLRAVVPICLALLTMVACSQETEHEADDAGEAIGEAGEAIGEAAEETAEAASSAAEDTTEAIEDLGEKDQADTEP